jgi:hypothetical protein
MSPTEEPDAFIGHVRVYGEPARMFGLVYPTGLTDGPGTLGRLGSAHWFHD